MHKYTKQEIIEIVSTFPVGDPRFKYMSNYVTHGAKYKNAVKDLLPLITSIQTEYSDYSFFEAMCLIRLGLTESPKCECGNKIPVRQNTQSPYKKYCSDKCRQNFIGNPQAEKVIIDGIVYKDFPSAISATGLKRNTIRKRIFDPTFPNYQWFGDHDAVCLRKIHNVHPKLTKEYLLSWKASGKPQPFMTTELGLQNGDAIGYALLYYQIEGSFSQTSSIAREVLSDKDTLENLYKNHNTDEIAKQLGVTPKTVQNYIHQHGIQMKYGCSESEIERHIYAWMEEISPLTNKVKAWKGFKETKQHIDIVVPDRNFGVEFNGILYHSENSPLSPKHPKYHQTKFLAAKDVGIELLSFTDVKETVSKLDIVKSMISNKLGVCQKVYARKCILKEVSATEARPFFDLNHIGGFAAAKIYLALEYNGEFVQMMSVSKPRFNKKYDWEIIRLASKLNTSVVGGASKLFKHFLDNTSGSVMTYADLRFGYGKVYETLGMNYINTTSPGYFYVKGREVYSRFQFQKRNIAKIIPDADMSKSETELAFSNGFLRFWDCGNAVYELIR